MIKIINNFIKIDTVNSSLILRERNNAVEKLYYGKLLNDNTDFDIFSEPRNDWHSSVDDTVLFDTMLSFTGDGNNREPAIMIKDEKGVFINRFYYKGCNLQDGLCFDDTLINK